jgi:hypothetical protein
MILQFTRNLEHFPFGSIGAVQQLQQVIPQLFPKGKWLKFTSTQQELYFCRSFLFPELARSYYFDPESQLLFVMGMHDHLHVLSYKNLEEVQSALEILHSNLKFAYDPNFGYLTSALQMSGTGLKVRFFHEVLLPQNKDSIEVIPYNGGFIYQNNYSIGYLETTLIQEVQDVQKKILSLTSKQYDSPQTVAQKTFDASN